MTERISFLEEENRRNADAVRRKEQKNRALKDRQIAEQQAMKDEKLKQEEKHAREIDAFQRDAEIRTKDIAAWQKIMDQREREQQEIQRQKEAQHKEKVRQGKLKREMRENQWRANLAEMEHKERAREENERIRLEKEKKRQRDRMAMLEKNDPKALREFRELIRTRYELDISIWANRKVRRPDRPYVEDMMEKSDAILRQIRQVVDSWDQEGGNWTAEEWECAEEIRNRLDLEGKREWAENPPWADE